MPRPLHTPSNHTTHFFAPREPEAALAFTPRVSHVVDSPSVLARIETLPSSFEVARVPLLQQVARVPHVNSGSCPHGNSGSCSTPFALVIFHVLFGNCPTAPSPVLLKRWLVFHPRSKQASYRTATIRPIVASPASSCARLPSRTGSDRIVGRRCGRRCGRRHRSGRPSLDSSLTCPCRPSTNALSARVNLPPCLVCTCLLSSLRHILFFVTRLGGLDSLSYAVAVGRSPHASLASAPHSRIGSDLLVPHIVFSTRDKPRSRSTFK
jgi:hypothetical protein